MRKAGCGLIILLIILLSGCKSTQKINFDVERVQIVDLIAFPERFDGKEVSIDGYVLGMETDLTDGETTWIVVIGDVPFNKKAEKGRVVFPTIKNKIRAKENGYNAEVIEYCKKLFSNAQIAGRKVRVYGVYTPTASHEEFVSGINFQISGIEVGKKRINTDYGDISRAKAKAPGMIKKVYKFGKKAIDIVK
jgi:hypothetical protein